MTKPKSRKVLRQGHSFPPTNFSDCPSPAGKQGGRQKQRQEKRQIKRRTKTKTKTRKKEIKTTTRPTFSSTQLLRLSKPAGKQRGRKQRQGRTQRKRRKPKLKREKNGIEKDIGKDEKQNKDTRTQFSSTQLPDCPGQQGGRKHHICPGTNNLSQQTLIINRCQGTIWI